MLPQEELVRLARASLQYQDNKKARRFIDVGLQDQQIPVFSCPKKDIWIFGGNRSGKSETNAIEAVIQSTGIIPHALKDIYKRPIRLPSQVWACSIDFPNSRDVMQKKILDYLPGDMRKKWDERNHILHVTNGSEIGFKSYDSGPLSFQGPSKDLVICDEEPPRDIRQECMMRLIDRNGHFMCSMTPTQGLTWVYDEIYLNPQKDEDIAIFFMSLTNNPFVSDEEKKRVMSKFTKEEWKMREGGAFISKTGTILQLDDAINIVPRFKIPKHWNRYRVIDPGIGHPTGCLWFALDEMSRRYCYREYLVPDRNVSKNAEHIIKSSKYEDGSPERILTTIIDPNSGNSRTYDSEIKVHDLYLENGIPCILGNDDLDAGIDRCRQALMPWPDGKSQTVFFDDLFYAIKTIRGYVWGSKRVDGMQVPTGKPKNINDDLPACWRYFEMYDPRYVPHSELDYEPDEAGVVNSHTGY